jgi:hypothetical protein
VIDEAALLPPDAIERATTEVVREVCRQLRLRPRESESLDLN